MSEVTNDPAPVESHQTVLTSRAIFKSAVTTALAYLDCEHPMVDSAVARLKQAFDEDAELDSPPSQLIRDPQPDCERARMEVTLGRHVRWRETALEFFHQVMNDRATEFKWPKLMEFVEQSETRVVAASPPSAGAFEADYDD